MLRVIKRAALLASLCALLALAIPPVWAAGEAPPGAPVLGQAGGDWRCVEVNGQTGLNVRQGPGVSFAVAAQLQPGEQVEADYSRVQGADGYNWLPLHLPGSEGWAITPRLIPCAGSPAPESQLSQINRDGSLDRLEIAEVAQSVVLVANVQGDQIVATGTGTVTTPDGLIVTNAHVVEDANYVAIGILHDINDPPEYRYLGDVVSSDAALDVALVAIRYDMDGNEVPSSSLNLAYLPATLDAAEVYRGDSVYIFGYPGIGDDYLVVTTGSIVSVENGEINGQRMPVWYRTDAEIAPGSSGGLVVNGNGEFVGIPTFVRSESETGGRLGGIRPAQVVLMAVLDEEYGAASAASAAHLGLERIWLDHGASVGDEPGLAIHVALSGSGRVEPGVTLAARFFHDDLASKPLGNPYAAAKYRDAHGIVQVSAPLEDCCAEARFELVLAIPYSAFGLSEPGIHPLKVGVVATGAGWQQWLSWEFITYTVP